jgi:lipopolysaccharide/colanic/teichoic acid biosynthesis glycosyltransferase
MRLPGNVWHTQDLTVQDVPAEQRVRRLRLARLLNGGLKKTLDITGATAGIILLLPLLVAVSVAIKTTSRGPVLFRQQRYGRNGELFTVLKFRTMHVDRCDSSGVAQTVENDPRLTAVGAFLRKSNFDELPQLINVLKGDMSLVGPRPHVPGMLASGVPYEIFDPRYMDRHAVLPGITGLAQVKGFRGETRDSYAARMRLEYDLAYVRRQSVLLDVKIISVTIMKEFFMGNGY